MQDCLRYQYNYLFHRLVETAKLGRFCISVKSQMTFFQFNKQIVNSYLDKNDSQSSNALQNAFTCTQNQEGKKSTAPPPLKSRWGKTERELLCSVCFQAALGNTDHHSLMIYETICSLLLSNNGPSGLALVCLRVYGLEGKVGCL